MQKNIISKFFKDKEIFFDSIDDKVYLNATKTALSFKKRLDSWKNSPQTIEYIDALADYTNIVSGDLIVVVMGGNDKKAQGTWIHQKLVIMFARWLSPEFAVWCDLQIEDIIKSQNSNSQPPKTQEEPIKKRVQLIHYSKDLFFDFQEVFYEIGITNKQELAITTNRAVKKETTIDFIAISGKNGLEAEEKFFTVTELCNLIRESDDFSDEIKNLVSTKDKSKAQPRNLNKILEEQKFQFRDLNQWKATLKGKKFSKFVQNKSLSSSKNIFHLNWKIEVLEQVFEN